MLALHRAPDQHPLGQSEKHGHDRNARPARATAPAKRSDLSLADVVPRSRAARSANERHSQDLTIVRLTQDAWRFKPRRWRWELARCSLLCSSPARSKPLRRRPSFWRLVQRGTGGRLTLACLPPWSCFRGSPRRLAPRLAPFLFPPLGVLSAGLCSFSALQCLPKPILRATVLRGR